MGRQVRDFCRWRSDVSGGSQCMQAVVVLAGVAAARQMYNATQARIWRNKVKQAWRKDGVPVSGSYALE